jgi:hypothetical protein
MSPRITSAKSTAVHAPAAHTPAAKPKAPVHAQATKAAGWSAASAGSSLKITHAAIDEGPKTTTKVLVPKGYQAAVQELTNKGSDKVGKTAVSLDQSAQNLTITTPGGQKVQIGDDPKASMEGTASDWRDSVAEAKKQPATDEVFGLDWDSSSTYAGAGTAGKLFSVANSVSDFTGGAHPNSGTIYGTYDASTGKQVKLDELLSPKQMNALVNDIAKQLPKLKTADGEVSGDSFGADKASIRENINQSFTVSQDKNGKVKLDLAWESGIHALGDMTAHFTVDAPNDPAFRSKVGLE